MNNVQDNPSNFILYTSNSGDIKVNVFLENKTIWLTQKSISELFGVESHTITYHLKEIYKCRKLEIENKAIADTYNSRIHKFNNKIQSSKK